MSDQLLVTRPAGPSWADFLKAADPDALLELPSLAALTGRLVDIQRAAGFVGVTLSLSDPTGGPGFERVVEEGHRLPPPEQAGADVARRESLDWLARSTLPFRWRSGEDRVPFEPGIPREVLREFVWPSACVSGFCVPVRGGLRRLGALTLVGRGRPDLDVRMVSALRIFAMTWFGRYIQIEAAAGERDHLTRRERECLQLAADGLTSEAIARRLALSKHTVDHHLVSATTKLRAANRAHAVAQSLRYGIVV